MEVLVFKTTLTRLRQTRPLRPGLDGFGRWTVDLGDCDRILRVETSADAAPQIIALLAAHGFECEELPD